MKVTLERVLQVLTLAGVIASGIYGYGVHSNQADSDHTTIQHQQQVLDALREGNTQMRDIISQHESAIADHESRIRALENSRRRTAWDARLTDPRANSNGK